MPQPADYLAAYAFLTTLVIMGCGCAVLSLVALIDHLRVQIKRRRLRNARR